MIVIAGKNDIAVWAVRRFAELVGKKQLAIVPNRTDDGKNTWQKSLVYFAKKNKIQILNLEEAEKIADIFISLEFDRIIKPSNFNTRNLYNIHFSLLPKYKGMYTSVWPILNGEQVSGCTLHLIDDGIDTGDVIDQDVFGIDRKMTSRDVYIKYIKSAINLLGRNVGSILEKRVAFIKQAIDNSSYYSKSSIDFSNPNINPRQTGEQILRFVRAMTFREYQLPRYDSKNIVRAEIIRKNMIGLGDGFAQDLSIVIQSIDYPVILYCDGLDLFLDACRRDDLTSVTSLIKNIVNVDDKTEEGWTPLMVAAYNCSCRVARYLIGEGADIDATNRNGTSVLMYAKDGALRSGNSFIFDLLMDLGADVFARDYRERNIFDYITSQEARILRVDQIVRSAT